ncbi:hypothetical protein JOF56_010903 [Kibdelosporangium banguiense]|uniref:DUF4328 domain-containing protein n=1 Tax=Kibdelosporangium banguiense TaxID=1365924 RepID=A0ABS4U2S5_9PSEU|nr:DUF4328 domain-containing protein [Kibdelosporangium banguiense]MBP2330518.1 hypothetical protein [Kibdelosporangium banguiense]
MSSEHRELGSSLFGSEPWQPVRARATIAMVGIALAMVGDVVDLVVTWRVVDGYERYLAGTVSWPELVASTDFVTALNWPLVTVDLVAGIAFLMWMWRAYNNAKFFGGAASQRLTQGWVVFGWMLPVVNFWFPYRMMSDIWRASPPVRLTRTAPILGIWWAAYLGATVIGLVLRFYREPDIDDLGTYLSLSVAGTVLSCAAGVLIYLIINQITVWQNEARDPDIGR